MSEEYLRSRDGDAPTGMRNEIIAGPVSDWAADFSHLEPEWAADPNGRRLEPSHVVGAMALLLIAGIDTSWSAIGASLWHLAKTPADRRRLVAEPGLLPTAIEDQPRSR